MGESRLDGNFSLDFFFIPIRGGAAFRNLSPSRRHTRGVQQRRHQLRLSGAAVAYNANVANVLGGIALHIDLHWARSAMHSIRRGPAPGLWCWGLRARPFPWVLRRRTKS